MDLSNSHSDGCSAPYPPFCRWKVCETPTANQGSVFMKKNDKFVALAALIAGAVSQGVSADTGKVLVMDFIAPHSIKVIMPSNAPSIGSDYRSVFNESGLRRGSPMSEHTGIDIKVPIGSPVLATADGRVTGAAFERFGGNTIRVDHGDLMTIYMHLDKMGVAPGDVVKRGQIIGASGRTSAEFKNMVPHLHLGVVRVKGTDPEPVETPKGYEKIRNPHLFWYDGPGKVTCFDENVAYADAADKFIYPVHCVAAGQN